MPEASTTQSSTEHKSNARSKSRPVAGPEKIFVPKGPDVEDGLLEPTERERADYQGRSTARSSGASQHSGNSGQQSKGKDSDYDSQLDPVLAHLRSLGRGYSQETFQRYADFIGDTTFSSPANADRRAIVVRELQRSYGNQYVQRLVGHVLSQRAGPVQAKLSVSQPGDPFEQEADWVAKQVVRMTSGPPQEPVQRNEGEENPAMEPTIQRWDGQTCGPCSRGECPNHDKGAVLERELLRLHSVHRQAAKGESHAELEVEQSIQRAQGRGQRLPQGVRQSMEGAFGADLGGVRVHTDAEADDLNRSVSARAFTTGQDIFFGRGEFSPSSSAGKELLAHELTHVVQQGAVVGRTGANDGSSNLAGTTAASGDSPSLRSRSSSNGSSPDISSLSPKATRIPGDNESLPTNSLDPNGYAQITIGESLSEFRLPTENLGQANTTRDVLAQREEDSGGWDILGGIRQRINGLVDGLRSSWNSVSNLAASAFSGFTTFLDSATGGLSSLVDNVVANAQTGLQTATSTVTQLTEGIRGQLGNWVSNVTSASAAIRDGVIGMDAVAINNGWQNLQELVGGVWSQLQQAQASLFQRVSNLWDGISSGFEASWSAAESTFNTLYEGLTEKVSSIRTNIEGAWEAVRDRAAGMGGIAGTAAILVQAAIDRLLSWGRQIWEGINEQWNALRNRLGDLMSSARDRVNGFWDTMSDVAGSAWEGIEGSWTSLEEWSTEQVSGLMTGVRDIWQRVTSMSIGDVVSKIASYSELVRAAQRAVDNPDALLEEVAAPIVGQLQAGMPAESMRISQDYMADARAQIPDGSGTSNMIVARTPMVLVQREARSVTPIGVAWEGFTNALSAKWGPLNILDLVKHVLLTLFWPPATKDAIVQELEALWENWTNAANDIFVIRNPMENPVEALHDLWSNIRAFHDFPIALWRHINNIAFSLWGYITLALMALGAIGGTVAGTIIGAIAAAVSTLGIATGAGAAAGGGAVGATGAGAGFGVAMAVGQVIVVSFGLAEGISLLKMIVDLLMSRQTDDQKERDFNQASDSFLALGILAALLAVGWVGGKIAAAAAPLFRKIPLPRSLVSAAEEFRAGERSTRGRQQQPTERGRGEELPPDRALGEERPPERGPADERPSQEPPVEEGTRTGEVGTEGTRTAEPGTAEPVRPSGSASVREVSLDSIRYSQKTVSPEMQDTSGAPTTIADTAADMRVNGWDSSSRPPDMVDWGDGGVHTVDHSRIVAARQAGLERIPARVHSPSEPLAADQAGRFVSRQNFTDPDTGIQYRKGQAAQTWGEAAMFRSRNQGGSFPVRGSPETPQITGGGR